MGTWGTGPFENDLAMDWFTELEEETSFSVIRRKIEEVITDDYLDADLVQEAVASLAIIVAIKTGDEDLLPEFETSSLDNLIELFAHKINDNILSLCEDAFGIITREEDNELYELWEEEDLLEDWLAYIEDLQERL
jgi:hypothetical protein